MPSGSSPPRKATRAQRSPLRGRRPRRSSGTGIPAIAPRVYRIPFSTNVERVALAAGHKGVGIEWVDVDPLDRSPVLDVSGQTLVPVLVDGDDVVADSPRIVEWLEERTPDPPLWPRERTRRAEVDVFVAWFNLVWKRAPNRIAAEEEKETPDRDTIGAHGAAMARALDVFESLLDGRPYLFGEFGVADVMAFPFLKYAVFGVREGDDERFHDILVEYQPLGDAYAQLRAWAARVDSHPRS